MIYKLPTRGATPYKGGHPENLRSVSASNGEVHVELLSGDRYVAASRDFIDLPRFGQGITNFIRSGRLQAITITAKMYADLLAAAQLRNQRTDKGAVRALLASWDATFAAEIK